MRIVIIIALLLLAYLFGYEKGRASCSGRIRSLAGVAAYLRAQIELERSNQTQCDEPSIPEQKISSEDIAT